MSFIFGFVYFSLHLTDLFFILTLLSLPTVCLVEEVTLSLFPRLNVLFLSRSQ